VVGDATGHGMPAALVMATTRGMLRAVVQSLESPGEVLAKVNEALSGIIRKSRRRRILTFLYHLSPGLGLCSRNRHRCRRTSQGEWRDTGNRSPSYLNASRLPLTLPHADEKPGW